MRLWWLGAFYKHVFRFCFDFFLCFFFTVTDLTPMFDATD